MATVTPIIGLEKPAQTDFYNVDVFSRNADRIDATTTVTDTLNLWPRSTPQVLNPFDIRCHFERVGRFVTIHFYADMQNTSQSATATLTGLSGMPSALLPVGASYGIVALTSGSDTDVVPAFISPSDSAISITGRQVLPGDQIVIGGSVTYRLS